MTLDPTSQLGQARSDDGAPEWGFAPGAELPGGTRAWERLAVGQRCETWLVWSRRPWCPAVLKLARPHQLTNARALRGLGREVAALDGAVHPSLPRLLADGRAAPVPHVLLEYVDGPSLDEELAEGGPLPPVEATLLAAAVLAGVGALHDRGLAHVDLKPENIVLRDGRPIVVDFGSARVIGARQPAGRPIGTAGYASPEQEACRPISAAMDVYSAGAVLFEALTGRPVFDPDLGPAPDLLHDALARAVSPDQLKACMLAEAVVAMLDPDPRHRPSLPEALLALARAAPPDARPWPAWADDSLRTHYPPPVRLGLVRTGGGVS